MHTDSISHSVWWGHICIPGPRQGRPHSHQPLSYHLGLTLSHSCRAVFFWAFSKVTKSWCTFLSLLSLCLSSSSRNHHPSLVWIPPAPSILACSLPCHKIPSVGIRSLRSLFEPSPSFRFSAGLLWFFLDGTGFDAPSSLPKSQSFSVANERAEARGVGSSDSCNYISFHGEF